jgi:hypothetical protein
LAAILSAMLIAFIGAVIVLMVLRLSTQATLGDALTGAERSANLNLALMAEKQ